MVASNALHVAADLPAALRRVARLLAPRGMLLAVEAHDPVMLAPVFGTLDSYWRFTDERSALLVPRDRWPDTLLPYIATGFVLSFLIQIASSFLPIPKSLPIDEFFKTTHAAWVLAIFGILIAPFFEELFFRGFLYPVLVRRIGFFASTVVTSLLFALTHEGQLAHAWAPLLVLFIVGVVLTYVRARTHSVACSFLVHSGYNAFLFCMIFVTTGGFRHMDKLR